MASSNSMVFFVNILVPILAGAVYFIMAAEIKRVSKVRKLIFGEIGYNKAFTAFLLFGIYFITRPFQNLLGPHPIPLVVNSIRQFFLMAVIAPSILVGIMHWVPSGKGEKGSVIPRSTVIASYLVGFLMAMIFIILNSIAIDGSKVIASYHGLKIYDARWFTNVTSKPDSQILSSKNVEKFPSSSGDVQRYDGCSTVSVALPDKEYDASSEKIKYQRTEDFIFPKTRLVIIHLITQLISPVGYFILAAAYVRHRRHNYPLSSVYNLMPKKWRYLEAGLLIFALSMITAGIAAFFGQYYTYLWVIYFLAAIIAGVIELISVKIPPREAPSDLKGK